MNKIKFNQNWNNKLDNNIFTTIRKNTYTKEIYYEENTNKEFEIILTGKKYGECKLLGFKVVEWYHLINNFEPLLLVDTGLYYQDAIKVFENFYGKIKESQDMIILIFAKVKK